VSAAGPLVLVAALVIGILGGERLGPGAALGLFAASVAVLVAGALVPRRARLAIAAVALTLLGAALMQRALDGLVHSPLAPLVDTRATVTIRGTLLEDPGGPPYRAEALMRVSDVTPEGMSTRSGGGRTVLMTADGDSAARLRVLSAGDEVTVAGWLGPLRDFDRYLRWKHAVGRLDVTELLEFGSPPSFLWRAANSARTLVLAGNASLPATERALMAGFLLGDTRAIPPAVDERFRDAGLTHLLAVSGANVAFVLSMAAPGLRRLGLRGRLIGGIAVLVLFGTMTRWEPSVLRAIVMAGASMVALYLGRPTAGLRVLALTAGVLLAADPFLVHSVGFLLSCGASAGILALAPRIVARLRGPQWVREALGVTAAAQIGVAPVLIPVFGSMPLAALPANLLVAPVVGPLTVGGVVTGVVGGVLHPWWPAGAALLQLPIGLLVRWVLLVADAAARIPITVDARAAWGIVALGALTAAVRQARMLRTNAPVPAR
jgi:competence protein ComEC